MILHLDVQKHSLSTFYCITLSYTFLKVLVNCMVDILLFVSLA